MTDHDWSTEAVARDLETLDAWRSSGFERHRRAALALARMLEDRMRFLSPEELTALAEHRGCHPPLPSPEQIAASLRDHYEDGEAVCRDLSRRIVDTAILGRDLLSLELHRLVDLAYAHRIEHGRMIGDWRDHSDLIGACRERFRHGEVFLRSLGLHDRRTYPQRSGAD